MGNPSKISRRTALAGKAALAATAAMPGAALAKVAVEPEAAALSQAPVMPARWATTTATELAVHVGERFRFHTQEHGTVVMRLVDVVPGNSGADRPGDLPRAEAVTALFESPDMEPLVAMQDGFHKVSHPVVGKAELYASAMPREKGGHLIQIVLN